jgi:peptide/nickel transport system permease protein
MSAIGVAPSEARRLHAPRSPLAVTVGRFVRRRTAVASLGVLCAIGLGAGLASLIVPHDPNVQVLANRLQGPNGTDLLGTDHLGRDELSRLLAGTRTSLLASAQATLIGMALGVPLGLVCGYVRAWLDGIVSRLFDALQSIPPLILAMAIIAGTGRNLTSAMVAIGIVFAPRMFRVARAVTIGVTQETYIEAARSVGGTTREIVVEHVLPNVLSPLIVQVTLSLGFGMLVEAGLSFLGLGVQPPDASLGSMLNTAVQYMERVPYLVIAPGLVIFTIVLCFGAVADGLRTATGRDDRPV